ncbi:MAG: hypothetical protein GXO39_05725 [Thermotogae bacterium]|nr:hypothetical protein [Thermotogota bacterium]
MEVFVVLLIVIILALLAYPKISELSNRSKVKSFSEEVYHDLEYARTLAFQVGSSKVVFDSNSRSYKVYSPSTSATPLKVVNYPENVTVTPSFAFVPNEVGFKRSKLPDRSGSIYISGYGVNYKIVVNAISGRIYLERQ